MPTISDREGVPHPRGGEGFTDQPSAVQGAVHDFMDRLHAEAIPKVDHLLSNEINDLRSNLGTKRGATPAKRGRLEDLESAKAELADHPGSAMEASVARVTRTAMAPITAVREHAKATGEMLPVSAGEFYGARHEIGQKMVGHYFKPGSEEHLRGRLATPEWSARTTPQLEVAGASGMLALLKHGEHVHFDVGEDTAHLLNMSQTQNTPLGFKGGHGGVGEMKPDRYSFNHLAQHYPQAAAILLQHHVKSMGLVTPQKSKYTPERAAITGARSHILSSTSSIDLPEQLQDAAAAMVSGYGTVGFPKGARSMSRFYSDPSAFGGHTFHKIPSYTWNIHQHDDVMAQGTHHFLGVLAHGKRWLDENPHAIGALKAAKAHEAWSDPTSTMDVWSGRVASGLPFHATPYLGKEKTNPEEILKGSGISKQRGSRYGSPGDLGYMWGEEAHRQAASNLSIRVPGVGTMRAPAHVVQSLSWYGVQGEENANQIRAGKRTMAPTSMQDTRSLNTLQFPEVF